MKILFLHHEANLAGAGVALYNIAIGLQSKDATPIFVFPRKGDCSNLLESTGFQCAYIKYFYRIFPPLKKTKIIGKLLYFPKLIVYTYYNLKALFDLSTLIRKEKIDIIHSNVGPLHLGYYLARKHQIPHVWHIREFQKEYGYKPFPSTKRYLSRINEPNNHLIAITKSIYDYYQMQKNNAIIIYDGVLKTESIEIEKTVSKKKENYILFLGGYIKQKGIEELLYSYLNSSIYKNNGTELWIAGSIEQSSLFREKIHQIAIKNSNNGVRILGTQPPKEVERLMQNAKALIVASHCEAFGFVSVEAMANDCLVIGRNRAGLKEQFDNGFMEKGREIAIRFENKEALKDIFNNFPDIHSKEITQIVEDAKSVVFKLYSIKSCTDTLYNYYTKILNEKQ